MGLCEVYDAVCDAKYIWYITDAFNTGIFRINTNTGEGKTIVIPNRYLGVNRPFQYIRCADNCVILFPYDASDILIYDMNEESFKSLEIKGDIRFHSVAGVEVWEEYIYLYTFDGIFYRVNLSDGIIDDVITINNYDSDINDRRATSICLIDKEGIWVMCESRRDILRCEIAGHIVKHYALSSDENKKYDFLFVNSKKIHFVEKQANGVALRIWNQGKFEEDKSSEVLSFGGPYDFFVAQVDKNSCYAMFWPLHAERGFTIDLKTQKIEESMGLRLKRINELVGAGHSRLNFYGCFMKSGKKIYVLNHHYEEIVIFDTKKNNVERIPVWFRKGTPNELAVLFDAIGIERPEYA